MVDELAEEYKGRVKVAKIDIDRAPSMQRRFGVVGIPCLIMFNDGKSVIKAKAAVTMKGSGQARSCTWLSGRSWSIA